MLTMTNIFGYLNGWLRLYSCYTIGLGGFVIDVKSLISFDIV
jgi:hypothetical protein